MLNCRLNLAIALSSALLLAGCADNGGIVRVELIKQAQEFCSDEDLKFRMLNSRFNDGNDDKSATATIDFVCESSTAAVANQPVHQFPMTEVPSTKVPSVLVPSAQKR